MTTASPTDALQAKLRDFLRTGIVVSDDVMHAIDATVSSRDAKALAALLSDPSDCEADTVLELMFYPEPALQEDIEPVLTAHFFTAADADAIAGSLARETIRVPVTLPHGRGVMAVPATKDLLRRMMERLHIDRQLHPVLSEALAHRVTEPEHLLRLRVMLRNHPRPVSDAAAGILKEWIFQMHGKSPRFFAAFRFLLEFLDYAPPGADLYFLLMKEKAALVQELARAEKSRAALRHHHVEALMLRGMSLFCVDRAELQKKIVLIDHICLALFGKTEIMEDPDVVETSVPADTGAAG